MTQPHQQQQVADIGLPDFPAIVTEDADGFRIAHVPSPVVPYSVLTGAVETGVAMIHVSGEGAIAFDSVVEHIGQPGSTTTLTPLVAIPDDGTYRDLLEALKAEADRDPFEGVDFVHLHTHTEYSTLDGLSSMEEYAAEVMADPRGGGAMPVTDHGNCAAHPELQKVADKYGMKAVFGMEAYFVPDRHRRSKKTLMLDDRPIASTEHLTPAEKKRVTETSDSTEARKEYTHLTLWAQNQTGLRNLWAMSTEAYRDGLYDGNPRLDWDTLSRLKEGVIAGTGCLRGPVARPLVEGDVDLARANLMRLHEIFGDRLYVEIHTNTLPDQRVANEGLVKMAREYGLPLIAAVDAHYSCPEHQIVHATRVAMSTGKVLGEETTMFQGNQQYHLKRADEVEASLAYLGEDVVRESMANTVEIAKMCTARIEGETTTPTFSKTSKEHPDPIKRDEERLREVCEANWARKVVGKPKPEAEYRARFEREMDMLVRKGFCGYYLIVWDYVKWAKAQGCLVGPGRGSGGGSLVAYLADIVEVDAVDADLIFERFMTDGRKSLPDFDIDFPSSWRGRITTYVKEQWGIDYVCNIGTVARLRIKAAANDVLRVMTPILPYEVDWNDFKPLRDGVDEAMKAAAGTGVEWEEFKAQYADVIDPLVAKHPAVFAMIEVLINRVKTYGKHAAGIVISTGAPLTDLPMRLAEDTNTGDMVMVTQFDMNSLEALGYVKFDFLTLRTLDTLQTALDLIRERYQTTLDPYEWKTELADPQVWDEVSAGHTLGIFQIETQSGTHLTKRMQPRSIYDLAAVMTVVRPGPMRSGLTEIYLRRRAGLEPVTYPDPRLEEFLSDTYGAMIYQEQVMATCMNLAGYNSTEADGVRKLLGKKQVDLVIAAGEEFVIRAAEQGTDPAVAETLWAQMAEFAKYGFNKAHAYAYAVLGYWCAFLRFHYPAEFLVAAMSTVDAERIPEFVEDCRRNGYDVVPPMINRSQVDFSTDGLSVIYGLSQVKGIGTDTAKQIVSRAPYVSLEDFTERGVKTPDSNVNMGHLRTLVEVGALDDILVNRKATEIALQMEADGLMKRCQHKTAAPVATHPYQMPCSFDWANEPDPPMLPKGRGKAKTMVAKPPPKGCNIKCRQFCGPTLPDPLQIEPYTGQEISAKERALLGVWITHSPFDIVPDHIWEDERVFLGSEMEAAPTETVMLGVAYLDGLRKTRDRNGGQMAFVTIDLKDARIEAICFASVYADRSHLITPNRLGLVEIRKTPRGYQLSDFVALT